MRKDRKNYKLILNLVLLLLWTGFILWHSLQDNVRSSLESGFIVRIFGYRISEHVIRKCAHIFEFALEGFLISVNLKNYMAYRKHIVVSVIAGAAVAALDEILQLIPVGRASSMSDVCIDTVGVVIGVCVCCFFTYVKHKFMPDKQQG